jgi:hypothetical protein
MKCNDAHNGRTNDTCCCCFLPAATSMFVPKECQAGSGVTNAASPETSPIFQAVRTFITGGQGKLPLTANWTVEQPTCSPACQFGTCIKVRVGGVSG